MSKGIEAIRCNVISSVKIIKINVGSMESFSIFVP